METTSIPTTINYDEQHCYTDLFEALFNIPDRSLQLRILRLVRNNMQTNKTQSTQTEPEQKCMCSSRKKFSKRHLEELSKVLKKPWRESQSLDNAERAPKRKRTTKPVKQQPLPVVLPTPVQEEKPTENSTTEDKDNNFNVTDFLHLFNQDYDSHRKEMYQLIMRELLISKVVLKGGILPIHDTIIKNDLKRLKRQVYIWKDVKNYDLNRLLTKKGEDCLQLCLKNDCFPSMIDHLLKMGLNPNSRDSFNNNVLHLAIVHHTNIRSMEYLLDAVDLNLFLSYNDDGLTPLHLAMKSNRYLILELVLNFLDIKSNVNGGGKMFERSVNDSESAFKSYYENECQRIFKTCAVKSSIQSTDNLKKKILEAPERCTGNTLLITATINQMAHVLPFLLAHMCNPAANNYAGYSVLKYCDENEKMMECYGSIYPLVQMLSKEFEDEC